MAKKAPENKVEQVRNKGRFVKGVSGNPGGRPAASSVVRALAQQHGPDAIHGLLQEARAGDTSAARIAAWKAILDRAYGTPTAGEPGADGEQLLRILTGVARGDD